MIYETTPYGVKSVNDKFVVEQCWWGKVVSPEFATKEEAEKACVEIARNAGCLRKMRR